MVTVRVIMRGTKYENGLNYDLTSASALLGSHGPPQRAMVGQLRWSNSRGRYGLTALRPESVWCKRLPGDHPTADILMHD